ncbi:MAG: glycosyltransferase family 29 protein [Myxococcota bacterium]
MKEKRSRPRVLVVGNSPSVRRKKLGAIVDRFDRVIRINNFAIDGFEEWVGTRTDDAVVSFACQHHGPVAQLKPEQLHVYLGPRDGERDQLQEYFQREDRLSLDLSRVDVVDRERYFDTLRDELGCTESQWPSTGLVAIQWAVDHFGSTHDVYIHGFSFFRESGNELAHYFDWSPGRDEHHDFYLEARYVQSLLDLNLIATLDAPITDLLPGRFTVVSHHPRETRIAVCATIHKVFLDASAPLYEISSFLHTEDEDLETQAMEYFAHAGGCFIFNGAYSMIDTRGIWLLEQLQRRGFPAVAYWHETAWTLSAISENRPAMWQAATSLLRESNIRHWVVSKAAKQLIAFAIRVPFERIAVVGEVIDPRVPPARRDSTISPVMIGSGVFGLRKGFDYFVDVHTSLNRAGVPATAHWYGYEMGVSAGSVVPEPHGVQVHDFVEDFTAVLAGADIFALTSRDDPQPLVALEALASDLPVFCFDSVGTAELLDPEFVARSPMEMVSQIRAYLRNIESYPSGYFSRRVRDATAENFVERIAVDSSLREHAIGMLAPVSEGLESITELDHARSALRRARLDLATAEKAVRAMRDSTSYKLGRALVSPIQSTLRRLRSPKT